MNARQMTQDLTRRAHSERIALAVSDLLKADDTVQAWCGPRVYRVPEATQYPNRPRPMLTVVPDLVSLPLRLQGEAEIELRLLITLFYDEPREILDDTDRGLDSMLHHLWWVLIGTSEARSLQVGRYGHRPLVQRSPSTPINYSAAVVPTRYSVPTNTMTDLELQVERVTPTTVGSVSHGVYVTNHGPEVPFSVVLEMDFTANGQCAALGQSPLDLLTPTDWGCSEALEDASRRCIFTATCGPVGVGRTRNLTALVDVPDVGGWLDARFEVSFPTESNALPSLLGDPRPDNNSVTLRTALGSELYSFDQALGAELKRLLSHTRDLAMTPMGDWLLAVGCWLLAPMKKIGASWSWRVDDPRMGFWISAVFGAVTP